VEAPCNEICLKLETSATERERANKAPSHQEKQRPWRENRTRGRGIGNTKGEKENSTVTPLTRTGGGGGKQRGGSSRGAAPKNFRMKEFAEEGTSRRSERLEKRGNLRCERKRKSREEKKTKQGTGKTKKSGNAAQQTEEKLPIHPSAKRPRKGVKEEMKGNHQSLTHEKKFTTNDSVGNRTVTSYEKKKMTEKERGMS